MGHLVWSREFIQGRWGLRELHMGAVSVSDYVPPVGVRKRWMTANVRSWYHLGRGKISYSQNGCPSGDGTFPEPALNNIVSSFEGRTLKYK